MTAAPVNKSDMELMPGALQDIKMACRACGIIIPKRTNLNLDPGVDSPKNRKAVWNAGLLPNMKENPRNRKKPKRGRKRLFDKETYALRYKCERSFGWEDKFRRIIVRYDWYEHLYRGFHLLAFAMINFRHL